MTHLAIFSRKYKMRKAIRNLILAANAFFIFFLVLAYLSVYISPVEYTFLAFCGLAYNYLLAANLLFVLFWALLRKWLALYSVIAILLGFNYIGNNLRLNFFDSQTADAKKIKLISYNVRLFNLYNWSADEFTKLKIFGFVANEKADIICLQEFYSKPKLNLPSNLDTLKKILKTPYFHLSDSANVLKNSGLVIFSKFKIVHSGTVEIDGKQISCIYADVFTGTDTLRIFNTHLASNKFGYDTYSFIDTARSISVKNIMGIRNIYKKISRGFIQRASQVEIIAAYIRTSPYRVVLCGDFNDTPVSYTYHKIKGKLSDSFEEAGRGYGVTYAGKFPKIRIDFVLHSAQIHTLSHTIHKLEYSDHYPIVEVMDISNL